MTASRTLTMDSIERCVRGAVCPGCYQRPPGSEALGNCTPRTCEPTCPIFLNLPALYWIAAHADTSAPGSVEKAVKAVICPHCSASATAGDFCSEWQNRTCPLSRFAGEVVTLIEALNDWRRAGEMPPTAANKP